MHEMYAPQRVSIQWKPGHDHSVWSCHWHSDPECTLDLLILMVAAGGVRLHLDDKAQEALRLQDERACPSPLPVQEALRRCQQCERLPAAVLQHRCTLALEEHLPEPEHPSEHTIAFRKALRSRAQQREYQQCTADIEPGWDGLIHQGNDDAHAPSVQQVLGLGAHVTSIMGTLAAVGYQAGSRLLPSKPLTGQMAGVIAGLVVGMLVESLLIAVRTSRGMFKDTAAPRQQPPHRQKYQYSTRDPVATVSQSSVHDTQSDHGDDATSAVQKAHAE